MYSIRSISFSISTTFEFENAIVGGAIPREYIAPVEAGVKEAMANGVIAGNIGLAARPFTAKPVSLTIGGQPSRLIYAGAAPYQSLGMLQINAYVPEGIGPGPQPVVLKVDNVDNTQQQAMIAIR